jgi:hypothetical protein
MRFFVLAFAVAACDRPAASFYPPAVETWSFTASGKAPVSCECRPIPALREPPIDAGIPDAMKPDLPAEKVPK